MARQSVIGRLECLYSGLTRKWGSEVIPGKVYTLDYAVADRVAPQMADRAADVADWRASRRSYVRQLPNMYRSETLILVVPQRVPESYVRSTVTARIEDRLQAISQQILSRTRLEQVINDFNLYAKERANKELMEDIIETMRTRDIGIDIIRGDSFRVSYIAGDPLTAMRVTERLGLAVHRREPARSRSAGRRHDAVPVHAARRSAAQARREREQAARIPARCTTASCPRRRSSNLQAQHNAEMQLQSIGESLNRDRERRITLERYGRRHPRGAGRKAGRDRRRAAAPCRREPRGRADAPEAGAAGHRVEASPRASRRQEDSAGCVEELEKRVEAQKLAADVTAKPASPVAPSAMDAAKRKRLADARIELDNLDRQIQGKIAEESRLQGVVGDVPSASSGDTAP